METSTTRQGPRRLSPGYWNAEDRRLGLPPDSAVCLRCGWLVPADGDASAAARLHTRTTAHPTVYRPAAPVPIAPVPIAPAPEAPRPAGSRPAAAREPAHGR